MRELVNKTGLGRLTAIIVGVLFIATMITSLSGCNEADRVSYNLSQQADNFNNYRQITVYNCIKGDVIFQMTGKMSIYADTSDNQLEVTVEDENGNYAKHFIGLSDNVTYVVEDITYQDVSKHHYTLNFNPALWLPFDGDVVD